MFTLPILLPKELTKPVDGSTHYMQYRRYYSIL